MATQSSHTELLSGISHLGADKVTEFESAVATQNELDLAQIGRVDEEGGKQAELVRQAAEREKAQLENTGVIELSRNDIEGAECELAAQNTALLRAEKGVGSENDHDKDATIQSSTENHIATTKQSKRQYEDENRAIPGQVVHPTLCEACAWAGESTCVGPIGHACYICSKQKKSCSNSSRSRTRDPLVMGKSDSPAHLAGTKHEAYSSTDHAPIGHINGVDINFNSPRGSSKRRKMGASQVRVDSIIVSRNFARPTRRSTRTTGVTTKEDVGDMFQRLGREFKAVAKTCEEIAGATD